MYILLFAKEGLVLLLVLGLGLGLGLGLEVLVLVVVSNDDVGVARGTVFQEIWPGSGSNTGDFVKEKLGRSCCDLIYHVTPTINAIKIKIHFSCEIKDFVETHLLQAVCDAPIARITGCVSSLRV